MHGTDPDPLLSISAAAERLGIDRSVLSRQIKSGAVRAHGKNVRLSEVLADRAANIDLTRSGRREGRAEHQDQRPGRPRASSRASARASTDARPVDHNAAGEADDVETVLVDGRLMTTAQARAMKETYLALLRKLEFEVAERKLIDRAAAEAAFFNEARAIRDTLLSWPGRVAIEMATALKIDARTGSVDPRTLSVALSASIHQLLTEMGEPEAQFA
ncbi:hypothetical protein [Methylobacterium sp. SD21]|uniref:hypothetical protein n=1 Tax=Methylobacterium litchii TaxID=3138810 RepID=UPI00313BCD8C